MPLPEPMNTTAALINAHCERQEDEFRPHMGASLLGNECDRYLWLSFHWAYREAISGRIRRLWARGHREEPVVIEHLKSIGIKMEPAPSSINYGTHVSGTPDGIISSGVPEAPQARHIFECKTHNNDSFNDLVKHGVEKSKPVHYAQCQAYMFGTGIDRALYVAVNKNDDDLYTERIKLDKPAAQALIARGQRVALMARAPEKLSESPTFYKCKLCSMYNFCHQTRLTNQVNCRTCAHSTATKEVTWRCEKYNDVIPTEFQKTGCEAHVLHPDLVPWELKPSGNKWEAVYSINAINVRNGEADAYIASSQELIKNADKVAEAMKQ